MLVEQNLDFTAELSSRVLQIQKGEIVRALPPESLRDPEIVAEFVGVGAGAD